jgi:hypothetical protein
MLAIRRTLSPINQQCSECHRRMKFGTDDGCWYQLVLQTHQNIV